MAFKKLNRVKDTGTALKAVIYSFKESWELIYTRYYMGQMFFQRHAKWNFTASSLAQLCHHSLLFSYLFLCQV